jgi:V/A-type H+-transporting ATPase subunit E
VGRRELIESLRRDADESVREIWKEAEAEAARDREETEVRISALEQHSRVVCSKTVRQKSDSIISRAEAEAREVRFNSHAALSERLLKIALRSLRTLREKKYGEVFGGLVAELPSNEWKGVRVNPGDGGLAAGHFPGAEVVTDERISGGMEVASEGGGVVVINTFEKRLERAWPEMLPSMLEDVYEDADRSS